MEKIDNFLVLPSSAALKSGHFGAFQTNFDQSIDSGNHWKLPLPSLGTLGFEDLCKLSVHHRLNMPGFDHLGGGQLENTKTCRKKCAWSKVP